jgi:hypothetical protein
MLVRAIDETQLNLVGSEFNGRVPINGCDGLNKVNNALSGARR